MDPDIDATTITQRFFRAYARALLDRDAATIADHYAVPALILFPDQAIAVADAAQTQRFFAGAIGQYDGIREASPAVDVVAATEHSIWADVTWTYDGAVGERNVYQLVRTGDRWAIAVLTPMTA